MPQILPILQISNIQKMNKQSLPSNELNHRHILIFILAILIIISPIYFQNQLSNFKSFGILGIMFINFLASATIFLPAPAIATVVAGGALYSPFTVALTSSFGASLGEIVGFLLGHSGKNLFYKKHHITFLVIKDLFHSFGAIIIFLVAFIPNPIFDLVGVFAGFVHYPLVRFFVLVFIARIIRNFLLASLGSAF